MWYHRCVNRVSCDARLSRIDLDGIWDSLDGRAQTLLQRFGELILQYRESARLTGLADLPEIHEVLVRESLALLPLLTLASPGEVADLGSGPGIPGIPLAVALPEVRVTVLERSEKKASFLRIVVNTLELKNVEVAGEDPLAQPHPLPRECVVTRGAVPLPRMPDAARKLLRPGGHLLGFASAVAGDGLFASLPPGLVLIGVWPYSSGRGSACVYWLTRGGEEQ